MGLLRQYLLVVSGVARGFTLVGRKIMQAGAASQYGCEVAQPCERLGEVHTVGTQEDSHDTSTYVSIATRVTAW